jgi:serine protease Do
MPGTMRYWSFVGVLGVGVVMAVVSAAAQGAQPPRNEEERAARREVRVLDGRGSRLGVMVQDVEPSDAKTAGVKVESVDPDSPAERAGVRSGDVVVEFDGERVRSARQFTRLVQETPDGRPVPLVVTRDGTRQTLTATPEARAFSWTMDIDGDRIRREVERSLEGLREFRMDAPPMRFRFDRGVGMRPRLGVSLDTVSDQLAQYFGAADGGALVTSVEPDSAAARAGLKAGDVITSINGTRVRDAEQVSEAVRDAREGDVAIEYLRDRKAGSTKATLAPRQAPSSGTPPEPRRPGRPA